MSILAAAPAVPAAGGVAITGALLVQLLAWAVLFALLYTYRYSFGALIRKMADVVDDIWLVGGDLADALDKLDHFVMSRLGDALEGIEYSTARTWDAMAWVARETGDALVAFGVDVHDAIAGLIYGEIPAQVKVRTRPLAREVADTRGAARARDDAEAKARARGIDRVNRDLLREKLARERGIDYVNTRINTVVLPGIRALDRTLDNVIGYTRRVLARRISRLEKLVLGGAIAAGALAVLTRYFPYWQCTNVRRFNRMLCRAPIGALDDLFGLVFLVVGSLSIVQFAEAMGEITEPIAGAVNDWIVED